MAIISKSIFTLSRILAVLFVLGVLPSTVRAQSLVGSDNSSPAGQAVTLPDPLTPDAVRELVSTLSDREVRDLLLERLDAVAKEQAQERYEEQSALTIVVNAVAGVGDSIRNAVISLPNIAGGISTAYGNFIGDRGLGGLVKFLGITGFSILLGFLANWIVNWLIRPLRKRFELIKPQGLWHTIRTLLIRYGLDLVKVGAFALVSLLATHNLHETSGDSEFAGRFITSIVIFVMLFTAFFPVFRSTGKTGITFDHG